MANKETILVVDDSPTQRAVYELQLESRGYDVRFADDGPAGEVAYRKLMCPVVILDVMLPSAANIGFNGFHLSSVIRGINPDVIIVIVTGLPNEPSTFARLLDSRADKILTQPTTIEEIVSEIRYAQAKREALKPRAMKAPTNRSLIIGFAVLFGALVLGLTGIAGIDWHYRDKNNAVLSQRQQDFENHVNAELLLIDAHIEQRTNDKFVELDRDLKSLKDDVGTQRMYMQLFRETLASHKLLNNK